MTNRLDDNDDDDLAGTDGKLFHNQDNRSGQSKQPPWVPRTSVRKLGRGSSSEDMAESRPIPITSKNSPPGGQPPPPPPPFTPAPNSGDPRRRLGKRFDWNKFMAAFWTVASVLSLITNLILIVALVTVGRELFTLKAMVGGNLLGGLYENFIFMDQSHIKTNINVADTIPINFDLPISQNTVVVLTEDTRINGATVRLNTGGVSINSVANIVLPAGTNLPVHLELSVPVNTTVPININVPVDIPLNQTELHKPFTGLQQVIAPFYNMLLPQIKRPEDVALCQNLSFLCSTYFK